MKLKPYEEVLSMGENEKNENLAPVRATRARKQAELEMAKLDEQIATMEADIHELCSSRELNFSQLISVQDELALLERRKKQYQKILDEMFPAAAE